MRTKNQRSRRYSRFRILFFIFLFFSLNPLFGSWCRVDEGKDHDVFLREVEGIDLVEELPLWVQSRLAFFPESTVVLDWSFFDNGWFILMSDKAHSAILWRIEEEDAYQLEIDNPSALFTNGKVIAVVKSESPDSDSSIVLLAKDNRSKYLCGEEIFNSPFGILAAAFIENESNLVLLFMGYIEIVFDLKNPKIRKVTVSNGSLESLGTIVVFNRSDLLVAGTGGVFELRKADDYSVLRESNLIQK